MTAYILAELGSKYKTLTNFLLCKTVALLETSGSGEATDFPLDVCLYSQLLRLQGLIHTSDIFLEAFNIHKVIIILIFRGSYIIYSCHILGRTEILLSRGASVGIIYIILINST